MPHFSHTVDTIIISMNSTNAFNQHAITKETSRLRPLPGQYATRHLVLVPRSYTLPASTCFLPRCGLPRDGPHDPWHPCQIFSASSRFSHLLKRNKTWDTSHPRPPRHSTLLWGLLVAKRADHPSFHVIGVMAVKCPLTGVVSDQVGDHGFTVAEKDGVLP